jgi:gamma-glutamyltranspeptidase/glutathione hydrolase
MKQRHFLLMPFIGAKRAGCRLTKQILLLSLAIILPVLANAQDRPYGKSFATRSEVIAQNGMACTSQPLATQAALDILRRGGNAIDAAIAANAVQGVVEPHVNGIGGDLFAIVYEAKTGKLIGLNGSGRSPYSLTYQELQKRGIKFLSALGPLAVTVPGCIDGWYTLHDRFGKMPMDQILAQAIAYARGGFPVSDEAAYSLKDIKDSFGKYSNFMELYNPGGRIPLRGEIRKNPDLANTLEKVAKGGRDAFYKGDIARTIDTYMKKNGGFLSYKDMADHTSNWVEPVSTNYRGYDVWELPPNGQGISVLQMLNILEGYDFSKIQWGSAEHVHLFVEAKKLAFEDRAKYYADPEFAKIPVQELISKAYAAQRRKLINPEKASPGYEAGNPALKNGDTIYLTVADSEGNMVSLIQSNYYNFGSGMVPDGLGFVLQNRGQLYTMEAGQSNTYAPHKRPFHTIIPGFVTKNGKPFMSFGVMGGSFQPLGHVQILMNMIDFGMNAQEAGDAPRIDHSGSSEPTGQKVHDTGNVFLEAGYPTETIRRLMEMGHKVSWGLAGHYGGYQSIHYDPVTKVYYGASESRKDGQAAGW